VKTREDNPIVPFASAHGFFPREISFSDGRVAIFHLLPAELKNIEWIIIV
jgi:hypothetical protein